MMNSHGEKSGCVFWVENALKTDYIFEKINPDAIRALANLKSDHALRVAFFVMICDLVGGEKQMPTKIHKIRLAWELVKEGAGLKKVQNLTKISKTTYFKMKRAARYE